MTNLLGYAASCAVLATFLMRTMVMLRLVGILSNLLFIWFGFIAHIYPVFLLHIVLLPINLWRLIREIRCSVNHREFSSLFIRKFISFRLSDYCRRAGRAIGFPHDKQSRTETTFNPSIFDASEYHTSDYGQLNQLAVNSTDFLTAKFINQGKQIELSSEMGHDAGPLNSLDGQL